LISAAGTFIGEWQSNLAGMTTVACQLRFLAGGGGTSVIAVLQSSLDQGSTAYDVAVVHFATAPRAVALSVLQGLLKPTDEGFGGFDHTGAAEVESIVLPVLGDRLRLMLIVSGTYTSTTLSGRIIAS
jgi:hypothetical protein